MTNKKFGLKTVLQYLGIAGVAILLAFNYQLFIVKNNFAPAGLNGIATMIQYKTGLSIGYMSLMINVPLCALAFFLIDRRFAIRSLFFCVVYSFSFLYLQKIGLEAFQYDAQGHDTIFPVILSGILSGFVYSICFGSGSSTGGTDIISKYINKIKPELNFFYISFALNGIVAISSFFVYAEPDAAGVLTYDYKPVVLCLMYCFISTFFGNYLIMGTKRACKFIVITTHADEISNEVFKSIRHGTTKIQAMGSYSHDEKSVLICVVNPHQMLDFKTILAKYDDTFAYCETVDETYGNFKKIK